MAALKGSSPGGLVGIRGAQTLRFPGFYARPLSPLESGPHFSKKRDSHSRGVEKFSHVATPLERELSFGPEMLPVRVPHVFFDLSEKNRCSLGRCRQNRGLEFYSGFANKNGAPKLHYFFGGRHVFQNGRGILN